MAAAEAADAAVIFAGLPECAELAAADRRHMRLPECQNNLIARVAAVQKNTVVVLHTRPGGVPLGGRCIVGFVYVSGGRGSGRGHGRPAGGDADPAGVCPRPGPCGWRTRPAIWISRVTA